MTKKLRLFQAVLIAALLCGATVAQEPMVDINKNVHPNLAEAQRLIVEANRYILMAQKDNRWDMHGHAEKARDLLGQVNEELKRAAETANRR
jgi:hypothetical protein